MKYGHFDEKNKEYVITNPATPSAWANYLGSPEYGAIISNNAGGYSFVKSGASGRISRYRFNSVTTDQPGRYIYLRDIEDNDYWSASWMPVGKPQSEYNSECRHGTAYTEITSDYRDIVTKTLYYVPHEATHEVWRLKVKNNGDKKRKLAITGYIEFTNEPFYEQDQVNLQYTLFITRTYFRDKYILQRVNDNYEDPNRERFFALCGEKVSAYCGDRDKFVGNYRGYSNPVGISDGLKNDLNYCGNSCGALQSDIELAPGESKELIFLLGKKPETEVAALISQYEKSGQVDSELDNLKSYWHGKLGNLQVSTPDDKFNNMVNVWNSYQCFITFIWSRAASFQYCGLRNGFGYRDTVQDIQGIIHLAPEMARKQIVFMLSAQVSNGAGLPLVKYDHKPGAENTPDDESYVTQTGHPSYRADDALWLFPTIKKYIDESGEISFLDYEILFADKDEKASVYEHLKRAIKFSLDNLGGHGMPAGLHADWNDCLRLGKKGESVFVLFQFIYALRILKEYADFKNDTEYSNWLSKTLADISEKADKLCWNGDRWIRGFTEDGIVIGKQGDPEASMWLNPQSWGVISGVSLDAEGENRGIVSMDSVYRELNTPYGTMLMYPPYKNHAFNGALAVCFNKGVKENAGIFCHSQGWAILAEALLGRGDRAYEYLKEMCPAYMNEDADRRVLEPYAHAQTIEAADSPFAGRAHVHWLTGTATTVMVAMVEGILGIKPSPDGIKIDPSIPGAWTSFSMVKKLRGKILNITVNNPDGSQSGVKSVTVNGKKLDCCTISDSILESENEVLIEM
ncbi:MAG: N,N'-diacetylchitobiose phosphorylase [Oscillospiraceae bacterium]|jgi:cellobiose phosphorylase|nr:N,N'-diacetylchitobiose phosphorylase [Oscillospiraceae bacterium]